MNAPDVDTLKGLRDRAILIVLVGCGSRRSEAAALTFDRVAQREGRWVIVDIQVIGEQQALQLTATLYTGTREPTTNLG